jgi:hypothetical protein
MTRLRVAALALLAAQAALPLTAAAANCTLAVVPRFVKRKRFGDWRPVTEAMARMGLDRYDDGSSGD